MGISNARSPAIAVTVNGNPVEGAIEAEIYSNSHLAANRFRVRLALDMTGAEVWSADDIRISIQLGLDGAWAPMILGDADTVEIDPIHGVVSVEGRDLTALFIEARTQETFENQTSSDIVGLLAARRGLAANVTATSQPVGRNFQSQHARTTLDQHSWMTTEWDLLSHLARQEGFDVWVDESTLSFGPPTAGPSVSITPSECVTLRLERTLSLDTDLAVAVKSWDCRGKSLVTQTASLGKGTEAPSYVLVRPNVTADVAQSIAQRVLGEMKQHARCIEAEMPGELSMQPRSSLEISDTGTDFDGVYTISDIERRISFERGFTQHVRARLPAWIASSI